MYPLNPVDSAVFEHLRPESTTYQPLQKSLEMSYALEASLENTEQPGQQILYRSKHIANRCNYFYSTLVPKDGCMVWRSVSSFLQMRPTAKPPEQPKPKPEEAKAQAADAKSKASIDKELEEIMMKRDGGRIMDKKRKSYEYVRQMCSSEPKVPLSVIAQDDAANYPMRNILEAASMPTKPTKGYSRQEYIRSLSVSD